MDDRAATFAIPKVGDFYFLFHRPMRLPRQRRCSLSSAPVLGGHVLFRALDRETL